MVVQSLYDRKLICAGTRGTRGDHGDSGGPLFYKKAENDLYQVGVTSTGGDYSGAFTANAGKTFNFFSNSSLSAFTDFGIYTRISSYCDWIHENTNQEVECVSLGMNRTPRPPPPPQEPTAPESVEPVPDANTDVPPEAKPLIEGEEETPKSSVKHGAAAAFMTFWMVFAYLILH